MINGIYQRDSKLRFMLKDSHGGNSILAIIGNVNLDYHFDTNNSLQFLKKTKRINNTPSINYDLKETTLEELTNSLKRLDEQNQILKIQAQEMKADKENTIKVSFKCS